VRASFGPFLLDFDARRLTRDGSDIHLSRKAFDVLRVLLARRPGVVSKADLLREIWPDVYVVEGNLTVLVGEIRRALDDDPQSPSFIRTVHGVGYAFCGRVREPTGQSRSHDGPDGFWLLWRGRTFPLVEGDNVIGRDPRCHVWLDHSGVSRRHARIRIADGAGRPVLTDLDSTNGTFLRGKRVAGATPLADGDVIKVGSVNLTFRDWTLATSRTRRIRAR
jgi:DNA-binding winged helix-turn-helix (wHTH) protein